jgi:hypothetical protein
MKRIPPVLLIALGTVLIAVPFLLSHLFTAVSAHTDVAIPRGREEPVPGEAFANGYNIPSTAPCNFADVYAGASVLTGPPIAGFTGRSQDFLYVRLLCSPLDPTKPVVYANLGDEELRNQGLLPDPIAKPHPLVAQYFADSQASGLDPTFYGRILSNPICAAGSCKQYTDRTLLLIDERVKTVRWAPLGCELNAVCARLQLEAAAPPLSASLPTLLVTSAGAFLLVLGLGLSVKGLLKGDESTRFYG